MLGFALWSSRHDSPQLYAGQRLASSPRNDLAAHSAAVKTGAGLSGYTAYSVVSTGTTNVENEDSARSTAACRSLLHVHLDELCVCIYFVCLWSSSMCICRFARLWKPANWLCWLQAFKGVLRCPHGPRLCISKLSHLWKLADRPSWLQEYLWEICVWMILVCVRACRSWQASRPGCRHI